MKKSRFLVPLALLAVAAYVTLVAIPEQVIHSERLPISKTPAEVGLGYTDFQVAPADLPLELAGWWMPAKRPGATLVFIHGGGSNRHTDYLRALEFYRALVEQGVSVATIDLRNHGASGSDGAGLAFGRSEKADAIAAVEWARQQAPQQPVFLMGISMGGATAIHAAATGLQVDGLILLDPLLDTASAFTRGAATETGLAPAMFSLSAWSATTLYGLPAGDKGSLEVGSQLQLPVLLLQDPEDPVTLASYARELAERNPNVRLWLAPEVADDHPELLWRERWGSHVAAFAIYPKQTMEQILRFMGSVSNSTGN